MVRSDDDAWVLYVTNIYGVCVSLCIIVYLCHYVLPSTTVFVFNTTVGCHCWRFFIWEYMCHCCHILEWCTRQNNVMRKTAFFVKMAPHLCSHQSFTSWFSPNVWLKKTKQTKKHLIIINVDNHNYHYHSWIIYDYLCWLTTINPSQRSQGLGDTIGCGDPILGGTDKKEATNGSPKKSEQWDIDITYIYICILWYIGIINFLESFMEFKF